MRVIVHDEENDLMPGEFWKNDDDDDDDKFNTQFKFSQEEEKQDAEGLDELEFSNIVPRTTDNTDEVDGDSDEEYEEDGF